MPVLLTQRPSQARIRIPGIESRSFMRAHVTPGNKIARTARYPMRLMGHETRSDHPDLRIHSVHAERLRSRALSRAGGRGAAASAGSGGGAARLRLPLSPVWTLLAPRLALGGDMGMGLADSLLLANPRVPDCGTGNHVEDGPGAVQLHRRRRSFRL